jgi:hypothetical protein
LRRQAIHQFERYQARSKAKLDFHLDTRLSAVTFVKLEARHPGVKPSINIY